MDNIFDNLVEKHKEGLAEVSQLAWSSALKFERERILKMLRDYFELTLHPDENGDVEVNAEWDSGFQAAIALISNEYNHPRQDRK
jgi:predicted metal-dependent hydrolase